MSLMLYGQTEPEPAPEAPADSGRRRYLIILAMVVVLIMAGGSAAYLLLSTSLTTNHPAAGRYPPPAVDPTTVGPTDDALASAAASASASASARASASASRSVAPSRTPGGGSSGGGAPAGLPYRLPSHQLCPAMDLTTIQQGAGVPTTSSGEEDHQPSHVDYSCTGGFGPTQKVKLFADAVIFSDTAGAAASYGNDKAGGDHVIGVGTDATGLLPSGGGFTLLVLDANLELKIHLIAVGGQPVPSTLRQWAIDSARGTLPHLHS
jgi:hypothetical protein